MPAGLKIIDKNYTNNNQLAGQEANWNFQKKIDQALALVDQNSHFRLFSRVAMAMAQAPRLYFKFNMLIS